MTGVEVAYHCLNYFEAFRNSLFLFIYASDMLGNSFVLFDVELFEYDNLLPSFPFSGVKKSS